jgi:hypothetical protein
MELLKIVTAGEGNIELPATGTAFRVLSLVVYSQVLGHRLQCGEGKGHLQRRCHQAEQQAAVHVH